MAILKQAEVGIPVPEMCREHGMSNATFYKWRSKYGGMDVSMISRIKELEEENRQLKKMCVEERLKSELRKEALEKSGSALTAARHGKQIVTQRKISIRLACDIYGISETCYRYRPSLSVDNRIIADWLPRLTHNQ